MEIDDAVEKLVQNGLCATNGGGSEDYVLGGLTTSGSDIKVYKGSFTIYLEDLKWVLRISQSVRLPEEDESFQDLSSAVEKVLEVYKPFLPS